MRDRTTVRVSSSDPLDFRSFQPQGPEVILATLVTLVFSNLRRRTPVPLPSGEAVFASFPEKSTAVHIASFQDVSGT